MPQEDGILIHLSVPHIGNKLRGHRSSKEITRSPCSPIVCPYAPRAHELGAKWKEEKEPPDMEKLRGSSPWHVLKSKVLLGL